MEEIRTVVDAVRRRLEAKHAIRLPMARGRDTIAIFLYGAPYSQCVARQKACMEMIPIFHPNDERIVLLLKDPKAIGALIAASVLTLDELGVGSG
jgi:hypothetical protein